MAKNIFSKISPKAYAAIVAASVVIAAVWGARALYNRGEVIVNEEQLTAFDPQNAGINISVNRPWFTHDAVFNVKTPNDSRDYNRIDVMRVLLQCAQNLNDTEIDKLYLANNGKKIYYLKGSYFRQLGKRYKKDNDWENAKLCIEMPSHTHTLNDSVAFKSNDGFLSSIQDIANWNEIMDTLLK